MRHAVAAAAGLGFCVYSAHAAAQGVAVARPAPHEEAHDALAAPDHALELGFGLGYAQPFGEIQSGQSVGAVATAGAGFELDAGYRATPVLALGAYGTGSKFAPSRDFPRGVDVYSAAAGVQATAHVRPARALDPWMALGTGWRGLWVVENVAGTTTRHGLELVRAQVGLDIRAVPNLSVAPALGAGVALFLTENVAGTTAYRPLPARASTFLFAGIVGRFDIGGNAPPR